MNFASAHLKARYVTAGSEFKAFVRMLIQNGVKRSKLAFSSPLIINISPFLLGSRGKCIFCDRGPRREQEFPLSTRSSRGLNETEVSAEEAIFHFGLSSLSSRDWNDPKVQRDRMEKREILKRSNFLPRVICSQRKKAGLNIVEIGILSFSPPLFSTYSYSKEGKKSLVQPRNHLFQARSIKYLKGFSSVHLPILFSVSLSRFHASLHRSIWRSSRNIRLEQRYIVFAIVERWKLAMLNWLDNFWKR